MFGNAPKALWEQWMGADDRTMICIASWILLVKTGKSIVLFETGARLGLDPVRQRFFPTDLMSLLHFTV
jgi:hypothetical protein